MNFLPTPSYRTHGHTTNKEEVTYDDLETGSGQHKAGYSKIDFCKKQASIDKLAYFWIDICCINRKSEPELSEAVNSMFRFYRNALCCYVFLPDVYTSYERRDTQSCGNEWEALFLQSRWLTRDWTLQELPAPLEHLPVVVVS
jgi:heterokaryon incompatibility protein (HET)